MTIESVKEIEKESPEDLRKLFRLQIIDNDYVYIYKEKLPSNMTLEISFQGGWFGVSEHDYYFNVYLNIYKKRKQISENRFHTTGQDGITPLVRAKAIIEKFEQFFIQNLNNKFWLPARTVIFVYWDDARRKRVYERGLRSLGYKMMEYDNTLCLGKVIHQK